MNLNVSLSPKSSSTLLDFSDGTWTGILKLINLVDQEVLYLEKQTIGIANYVQLMNALEVNALLPPATKKYSPSWSI